MAITRINEFCAAPQQEQALHQFLLSLMPYIRGSEGCLSCEVLQHQDNADTFVVIEKWQSVQAHQQSIAGFPKDDMQAAMSLCAAPPSGAYYID